MTATPPTAASVARRPAALASRLALLDAERLSTPDRVLLAIIVLTLAGTCFLISAAPGSEAGQQPWSEGSVLRVVAELMAFNYEFPTRRGVEIKWLVHGLGAAAAVIAAVGAWFARTRDPDEPLQTAAPPVTSRGDGRKKHLGHLSPAGAAQLAFLAYAGWAMFSAEWAPWPEAAVGEGFRQLIVVLWAMAIGRSLSIRAARRAGAAMVVILAVTALLSLWYYVERNPEQRLKFPIGNPIFFAACLIPGITLAVAGLAAALTETAHARARAASSPPSPRRSLEPSRSHVHLLIAAAVALVPLLFAFWFADSRGPAVGLVVGAVVAATIVSMNRLHHKHRIVAVVLLVLFALVGTGWLWSQTSVEAGGRGATVRARLYAWHYAWNIFHERPDIGRGQGACLLLGQQMSIPDAERDPQAFPGALVGHAHNEWLEVLADLGAVGFALVATGLAMTLWAGVDAWRRSTAPRDRWCILGLLAAFVALIVEETFDVALRMPGLPAFFFTIVALIWVYAGATPQNTAQTTAVIEPAAQGGPPPLEMMPRVNQHGAPPVRGLIRWTLRWIGLIAALGVAAVITSVVWRDWEGALAENAAYRRADANEWDDAVTLAQVARTRRLVLEDYISADLTTARIAHLAAEDRIGQLQAMLARQENPDRLPPPARQLALEDLAVFDVYAGVALEAGIHLLERMPTCPWAAEGNADVLLLAATVESIKARIGVEQQVPPDALASQARAWLEAEFRRDRLDPQVGLKLLALSAGAPLPERIDMIRLPLRAGPMVAEVEPALVHLLQEAGFMEMLGGMVEQARRARIAPDPSFWPDAYAPETLRLGARLLKLRGQFDGAVELTRAAVTMYEQIRRRFPNIVSHALLEQARFELYADPGHADLAARTCEQAISAWPPVRERERELVPLYEELAVYQLAAGREDLARHTLRRIEDRPSQREAMDVRVGRALAELCTWFIPFPDDRRPAEFESWLNRCLELAPAESTASVLGGMARVHLQRGLDARAIEVLKRLAARFEPGPSNPVTQVVRSLLAEFGASQALQEYGREVLGSPPAAETQPAASMPAPPTIVVPDFAIGTRPSE